MVILENLHIQPVYVDIFTCKSKQPIGYFVPSSTPSPDLLKHLLLKCIKIASEYVAILSKL